MATETEKRLFFLREILRNGVKCSVEHLNSKKETETSTFTDYEYKYVENVICHNHFYGGGKVSTMRIHKAAQTILRLIRDNHEIKIEDIYCSVMNLSKEERKKHKIIIVWDENNYKNIHDVTIFCNMQSDNQIKLLNEHLKKEKEKAKNKNSCKLDKLRYQLKQFVESRKSGQFWDTDEDIDKEPDLSLPINKDIATCKTIYEFLKNGIVPPDEMIPEYNSIYTAIRAKSIDCIKWVIKKQNLTITSKHIRHAVKYNFPNGARYLIETYGPKEWTDELEFAVKSGDKDYVDYLISKGATPTCGIFESENWELAMYVHNYVGPITEFGERTLAEQKDHPDRFLWLLNQGAPRLFCIYWALSNDNSTILPLRLDTESVNYETREKRDPLLVEAANKLFDSYELSEEVMEKYYCKLIERGLWDKYLTETIEYIRDIKGVKLFLTTQKYVPKEMWDQLLNKACFQLLCVCDCTELVKGLFDICCHVDFDKTIDIVLRRESGPKLLANHFEQKHGNNWADKINKAYHYYVVNKQFKSGVDAGFKVYRSIFTMIGYNDSNFFFERCDDEDIEIIEDIHSWERQIDIINQYIFEDKTVNPIYIKEDRKYRVIVFSTYEYQNEEGYFLPNCLYDISNVSIIKRESHKELITIKLRGKNDGPYLIERFEPEWKNVEKDFYFEIDPDPDFGFSFYTGRDGGSLNCGGCYFVKIIEI